MLNKLFSNAYARMRYLRFSDMRPFLIKVFNVSMSFMMIFTLAFVTIETIDPDLFNITIHEESNKIEEPSDFSSSTDVKETNQFRRTTIEFVKQLSPY